LGRAGGEDCELKGSAFVRLAARLPNGWGFGLAATNSVANSGPFGEVDCAAETV